jgi:hypothetical protein
VTLVVSADPARLEPAKKESSVGSDDSLLLAEFLLSGELEGERFVDLGPKESAAFERVSGGER